MIWDYDVGAGDFPQACFLFWLQSWADEWRLQNYGSEFRKLLRKVDEKMLLLQEPLGMELN